MTSDRSQILVSYNRLLIYLRFTSEHAQPYSY
jgi:hypothetical protein